MGTLDLHTLYVHREPSTFEQTSTTYTVSAILQENVYYWQSVASRTFHAKTMLRGSNTASAYCNIGKMLLEASFFDELDQLHSSYYIVLSLEVRALCLMGSLFPIFPKLI